MTYSKDKKNTRENQQITKNKKNGLNQNIYQI